MGLTRSTDREGTDRLKITKRSVDAAHPKAERYIIWDAELKGFGLLVLPTGGASGPRETILEDAASYGRLFQTLDRLEATRIVRSPVADTIRLIALTGCRRGEAIGLRWRHVDLKNDRLVLSPAEHKTGRKTGKPREINLPTAAQAIIARQHEGDPDQLVFRASRGAIRSA
jgi:integrase